MKKTFKMILWSVRWLLVLLLPIAGLFVAVAVMPEHKPLWETKTVHLDCAGIIADELDTYLLGRSQQRFGMSSAVIYFTGYDLKNGAELFTEQCNGISEIMRSKFIPGTPYLMTNVGNEIRIFDTKLSRFIETFSLPNGTNPVEPLTFKNNVIALKTTDRTKKLITYFFWHQDSRKLVAWSSDSDHLEAGIRLSSSGRWAVLLEYDVINKQIIIHILDTLTGKLVQKLPKIIFEVIWDAEEEAFLALQVSEDRKTKNWQKYSLDDQQLFVTSGKSWPVARQNGIRAQQTPSRFLVLFESTDINSARIQISKWLGAWSKPVLDTFWPEGASFHLFDLSGRLINSMTIRGYNYFTNPQMVHPDPSGRGLILEDRNRIAYWEFNAPGDRYPWYGLIAGSLGSVLLLYFNIRSVWRKAPNRI